MIDVYGHKEQRRCIESLRLLGGRSPGSRDSRRPPHRALVEGSQKYTGAASRLLKISARCKRLKGKSTRIPSETDQLKHRLCTLLTLSKPTCRQSSGTQPRCIDTSKTSIIHATAVVDDERGHWEKSMTYRPQDPSLPLHVENRGMLPRASPILTQNKYSLSNQALRDPCTCR